MFEFLTSFFKKKHSPHINKIYVEPLNENNQQNHDSPTNEISNKSYHLSQDVIDDFLNLINQNKYSDLEDKINKIPNNLINFDEDIGSIIITLSSKGDIKKDKSAIKNAEILIEKIDKDSIKENQSFDFLWGIANNRTGETTSEIFKYAVNHGFKIDEKRYDGNSIEDEIRSMSKGFPENVDLNSLDNIIKSKIKCDLEILEFIKEISNSKPSISPYSPKISEIKTSQQKKSDEFHNFSR